jgi:heme oxygenase
MPGRYKELMPMTSIRRADDTGGDLRGHLRAATKEGHHRLDHHPLVAPLVVGGLTRAGYGNALLALHALHAPLERTLTAFRPDTPPPIRSVWLEEDLAALGRRAEADAPSLPRWNGAAPASPAAYVGMRYVIEGSALGGRVIRRQFDQILPADCHVATRFFDGFPDDSPWQNFWRVAEALEPLSAEEAADSARQLFAEIDELWNRHLRIER